MIFSLSLSCSRRQEDEMQKQNVDDAFDQPPHLTLLQTALVGRLCIITPSSHLHQQKGKTMTNNQDDSPICVFFFSFKEFNISIGMLNKYINLYMLKLKLTFFHNFPKEILPSPKRLCRTVPSSIAKLVFTLHNSFICSFGYCL